MPYQTSQLKPDKWGWLAFWRLRWSPKIKVSTVCGCPSDIPIIRCLRWSPITQNPEVISRLPRQR